DSAHTLHWSCQRVEGGVQFMAVSLEMVIVGSTCVHHFEGGSFVTIRSFRNPGADSCCGRDIKYFTFFPHNYKIPERSIRAARRVEGSPVSTTPLLLIWASSRFLTTKPFQRLLHEVFDQRHFPGAPGGVASPSNPSQRYIKRIVALEGDTVKTLSYKDTLVMVPSGHCWVEGDHHGRSVDSNFFGPVSTGLITGKASYIVWPPSRWGRLDVVAPDAERVYKCRACFGE
ncbi:hypothetical protein BaRGS_00012608, partial [Batillaria attramentaria]